MGGRKCIGAPGKKVPEAPLSREGRLVSFVALSEVFTFASDDPPPSVGSVVESILVSLPPSPGIDMTM